MTNTHGGARVGSGRKTKPPVAGTWVRFLLTNGELKALDALRRDLAPAKKRTKTRETRADVVRRLIKAAN